MLKDVLIRLGLPQNNLGAFNLHRLYNRQEYLAEQGPISMYIYNNTTIPNLYAPILSLTGNPISLPSLYTTWGTAYYQGAYLDLDNFRMISRQDAEQLVLQGADNGILDGQPFPIVALPPPPNPNPPGPPPPGPPPPPQRNRCPGRRRLCAPTAQRDQNDKSAECPNCYWGQLAVSHLILEAGV